MTALYTNLANSTVAVTLTNVGTSLTVAAGDGAKFASPTGGDHQVITLYASDTDFEIVHCTARSGDVLTITRAQEGTTSRQWEIGEVVSARITKGILENLGPVSWAGLNFGAYALDINEQTTGATPVCDFDVAPVHVITYTGANLVLDIRATLGASDVATMEIYVKADAAGSGFDTVGITTNGRTLINTTLNPYQLYETGPGQWAHWTAMITSSLIFLVKQGSRIE